MHTNVYCPIVCVDINVQPRSYFSTKGPTFNSHFNILTRMVSPCLLWHTTEYGPWLLESDDVSVHFQMRLSSWSSLLCLWAHGSGFNDLNNNNLGHSSNLGLGKPWHTDKEIHCNMSLLNWTIKFIYIDQQK